MVDGWKTCSDVRLYDKLFLCHIVALEEDILKDEFRRGFIVCRGSKFAI